MLSGRTWLGWRQLVHRPGRFTLALAGVGFAVVLMFMQLGFMNMLFDTTVMLHRQLAADLVIVSPKARDMVNVGTFPRRRLVQALAVPGVADGEALYVSNVDWRNKLTQEKGQTLLIGVRPDFAAFRDPAIAGLLPLLSKPGSALFDRGARGEFGWLVEAVDRGEQPTTELAGRTVTVEGLFRFGATFGSDSTLIVSDHSFMAFARNRSPGAVNVGLLQIAPDHDPAEVAARVRAEIDGVDAMVLTTAEFVAHTRGDLMRRSPIAFIFGFGAVMGLVVGGVLVAQILSSDVQDHLGEYATFKAIGFRTRFLVGIVFEQSAILTVLGFIPGLLAALGLYEVIRLNVAMPITMPISRVGMVLAATATMCALAGVLALGKVARADPADVF